MNTKCARSSCCPKTLFVQFITLLVKAFTAFSDKNRSSSCVNCTIGSAFNDSTVASFKSCNFAMPWRPMCSQRWPKLCTSRNLARSLFEDCVELLFSFCTQEFRLRNAESITHSGKRRLRLPAPVMALPRIGLFAAMNVLGRSSRMVWQSQLQWSPSMPHLPQMPSHNLSFSKRENLSLSSSCVSNFWNASEGTTINWANILQTTVFVRPNLGFTKAFSPTHMPGVKSGIFSSDL
mmetsp:Transcript_134029/g.387900  ORF Transcript_134029/g.387900 Transcript_134029/m.387900 type:complete len:235 (-) Transcript_134029:450-1154(-)